MKLALGTAQFGLDYGISNRSGKVEPEEIAKILHRARDLDIELLDTAALYGDSETVLGKCLTAARHPFKIITKTERFVADVITAEHCSAMKATFHESLERLGCTHLYGLLVHDADDLLKPGAENLALSLQQLKDAGLVHMIGVSVYTGNQIEGILKLFTPDIIQLPLNVFDQRLIKSGMLSRIKAMGVEIHARSAFLQGLLLMDPDDVDPYFEPIRQHLRDYASAVRNCGLSALEAALQFMMTQQEVTCVLVGVCSVNELEEIHSATMRTTAGIFDFSRWGLDEPRFLNPSLWQRQDSSTVKGSRP